MSPEMNAAVTTFAAGLPPGCTLRPQQTRPIYTLVTVDGWPRDVHYEFRSRSGGRELYVEIHIEHPDYLAAAGVLRSIATEIPSIQGFPLEYFESRPWPHRKKWPSVSIALPVYTDGETASSVMNSLISMTRDRLDRELRAARAG